MSSLPEPAATLQAMTEALAAEDFDRAQSLLEEQDRQVRAFAALAAGKDDLRPQLIELQRLQVALIDLLRQRQCATIDELQTLGRGSKASLAYRSEGEP